MDDHARYSTFLPCDEIAFVAGPSSPSSSDSVHPHAPLSSESTFPTGKTLSSLSILATSERSALMRSRVGASGFGSIMVASASAPPSTRPRRQAVPLSYPLVSSPSHWSPPRGSRSAGRRDLALDPHSFGRHRCLFIDKESPIRRIFCFASTGISNQEPALVIGSRSTALRLL